MKQTTLTDPALPLPDPHLITSTLIQRNANPSTTLTFTHGFALTSEKFLEDYQDSVIREPVIPALRWITLPK